MSLISAQECRTFGKSITLYMFGALKMRQTLLAITSHVNDFLI